MTQHTEELELVVYAGDDIIAERTLAITYADGKIVSGRIDGVDLPIDALNAIISSRASNRKSA
jgi:hypothetical protein